MTCDVLIVGAGSAGCMSAIRAKEVDPRLNVVVLEKSDHKYSGCIARGMDALNIVTIPGITSPEKYVECNRDSCAGILDEDVCYEMAKRSYPLMQKLVDWGVCFPMDENGEYDIIQTHAKAKYCVAMQEPELKVILAQKMKDLGVTVLDRTMGVEVLKDNDAVCGMLAMNTRTGERLHIKTPTVILTSGGTARFGLPNNGNLYGVYDFPGNTGDGYCMAYRAGAELSGLEYTMSFVIVKDANSPLLYITLTRGAKLYDGLGQLQDSKGVSVPALQKIHMSGCNPLTIDMRHLDESDLKYIENILFTTERPACERFFEGRGVNFRNATIELWPTELFLCGGHGLAGVRVNPKAETCVPGLYAAGDTSLVARGHLTGAFVYGEIAAENAAEYCKTKGSMPTPQEQIDAFEAKVAKRLGQNKNQIAVEECEYKVRRMINDYLSPPKNQDKLERCMKWMDQFHGELDTMVKVNDFHDLYKIMELENIITCAKLSAKASLTRKESRWIPWHYRIDYPEPDDATWTKHIVLTMGEHPLDIRVGTKDPVRLNLKAPEDRA